MNDRSSGGGFGSFLLGVAVGAVVGFLFAPEAGDDTRRKLSKRLRNLRDAAGELVAGEDEDEEPEDEQDEDGVSTREQLRRRLDAARRRRRREDAPARMEEEEEPLA